jgi:hypothetical protein
MNEFKVRQVPEILHAETIARTRLFRVERLNLRFANGTEACSIAALFLARETLKRRPSP